MRGISRRSALLAACGSLASVASVGAWLVTGRGPDEVPAAGRRIRTGFGSVQVVASRWEAGGARPGSGSPEAAAGGADRVVVLVAVRNDSATPVRVVPAQFALRLDGGGPAVGVAGAEPHGGTVGPGRVLHLRLTFVVGTAGATFGLEYRELGAGAAVVAAPARRR